MISGASKTLYWLSNYLIDLMTHSLSAITALVSIAYFEIDAPDVVYLLLTFVVVNPISVYAMSFCFWNESQASIFVRLFYFAFGGVAPIAI